MLTAIRNAVTETNGLCSSPAANILQLVIKDLFEAPARRGQEFPQSQQFRLLKPSNYLGIGTGVSARPGIFSQFGAGVGLWVCDPYV